MPYINEDDVEVEIKNKNEETELRPYRAKKYILEYYGNQDTMTKELFNKKILTYKLIANTTGLTETLVKNAITKQTENPDVTVRRILHIFFNKDLYPELPKYNSLCEGCRWRKCKQEYWVDYVVCPKYKKSTRKKK